MNLSKFVEYVKVHATWKNKPDKSTPVDAASLMKIESGIKSNNDAIKELAAAVVNQIANDPDKIASMAALYAVNQKVEQQNSDLGSVSTEVGTIKTDLGIIADKTLFNGGTQPGTKNFALTNTKSYLLTVSTGTDAGCVLVTAYAEKIVWKVVSALPAGASLARIGLTLGITTTEIAVIALQQL